jgi:hypothetical protein
MKNIILVAIILLLIPGIASARIDKIVTGYSMEGLPNDYIDVYINATGVYQIKEIRLELIYNPDVITLENISIGDLISGGTTFTTRRETGNITFNINNSDGLYGSDSLAKILFKSIGSTGESSPLNINLIKVTTTGNYDLDTGTISVENSEYLVGRVYTTKVETTETTIPTIVTTTPAMTETIAEPTETVPISTETTPISTETTPISAPISTPVKQTPGFVVIIAISTIIIALVIRRIL